MTKSGDKGRSRPTIAQVAKLAGVSASTVSRVLNGYKNGFSLTPERRDKVLEAVRELGYRPDAAASLLRGRKTPVIAVYGYPINTRPLPSIYPVMLGYATDALAAQGCEICSRLSSIPQESFKPFPWRIDGALVVAVRGRESVDAFEENRIPYVVMNGLAGPNGLSILVDESDIMEKAVSHLTDLGHTRIAYRGTERNPSPYSVAERHEAMRKFSQLHEIPWLDSPAVAQDAPETFLTRSIMEKKVTAVIAYSHVEAMSLFFAAMRMGWSIPERFSLICVNDVYPCDDAGITTIALPLKEIGETGAAKLWSAVNDGQGWDAPSVSLKGTLHARRSTARPAAGK
ncbi:MAG: LacI family DNA-binding transcriptional regulator [Planctomycetes bacterium]|nr:LacI family DNA-binding transcriptional regulator [Planctomycetota bacterium]